MVNDPYSVLGLPQSAGEAAIRERYRQLAKLYHPDLHPDNPAAVQKMNELNEAYEQMRSASFLPPTSARPNAGKGANGSQAGQNARTPHDGPSAEDLWEELFRNGEDGQQRYQRPRTRPKARTVLLRAFLVILICYLFIGFFSGSFMRLASGQFNAGSAFDPRAAGYHGLPFSGYQTAPSGQDKQEG